MGRDALKYHLFYNLFYIFLGLIVAMFLFSTLKPEKTKKFLHQNIDSIVDLFNLKSKSNENKIIEYYKKDRTYDEPDAFIEK